MKKTGVFLSVLLASSVTVAQAESDKSKYCPHLSQIKIALLQPYRYIFEAHNSEGKYFVSVEEKYDDNNGPAHPLNLEKAVYKNKNLSCIYIAFDSYTPSPTLTNYGDY